MKYVPSKDRVRMTGLRERRVISVLTRGDGSDDRGWSPVIWPNRAGHEGDMDAADAMREGVRLACEAMQERCLGELELRLRRCHDHACRKDNECQRCQALQYAAQAIRGLEL